MAFGQLDLLAHNDAPSRFLLLENSCALDRSRPRLGAAVQYGDLPPAQFHHGVVDAASIEGRHQMLDGPHARAIFGGQTGAQRHVAHGLPLRRDHCRSPAAVDRSEDYAMPRHCGLYSDTVGSAGVQSRALHKNRPGHGPFMLDFLRHQESWPFVVPSRN